MKKYSLSEINEIYNLTKLEMAKIIKYFSKETDRGKIYIIIIKRILSG